MNASFRLVVASLLAFTVLSACRCGTALTSRAPAIDVGTQSIDFGRVALDFEHLETFEITNRGTVALNVTGLRLPPESPFSVKTALPLVVGSDETVEVTLGFLPTRADVRETATLVIVSDDPEQFEVNVELAGTGILAVAGVAPAAIDFGDVYVGDTVRASLSVTNLGTAPLPVMNVTAPTTAGLSSDLAPLQAVIAPGATATGTVSFTPGEMGQVSGEIVLMYAESQGGTVTVAITGRGVAGVPQLCVASLETGMESCTPVTATGTNGQGNLTLQLPPKCDIGVFPEGSGATACTEEEASTAARFFVRNAGNIPFSYTLSFDRTLAPNPCGLAEAAEPDFTFANAPMTMDGGTALSWSEATVSLPQSAGSPMPWETAPVDLAYRATSRCPEETSDQARIFFFREGTPVRDPSSLSVIIQGSSRLPELDSVDWSCEASASACRAPVTAVRNFGPAPAEITALRIFQLRAPTGDFPCNVNLDAGTAEPCSLDGTDTLDNCRHFRWALDGGNPEADFPILVDAGSPSTGPASARVGVLEFAHEGFGCGGVGSPGVCSGQTYCLYGTAETNDPYHPEVTFQITGRAK